MYARQGSNLQSRRHLILSQACIPISTTCACWGRWNRTTRVFRQHIYSMHRYQLRDIPQFVPLTGVEPARLSTSESKSELSANSNTEANKKAEPL